LQDQNRFLSFLWNNVALRTILLRLRLTEPVAWLPRLKGPAREET
jgi:hypothetical protein